MFVSSNKRRSGAFASVTEVHDLKDTDQETVDYVRRHYGELREAGLTSWTFDEFFAFCRPFAARRRGGTPAPIRVPASAKAEQLADALSSAFERKYGKPLSEETRAGVIKIARDAIVERNRNRLKLI